MFSKLKNNLIFYKAPLLMVVLPMSLIVSVSIYTAKLTAEPELGLRTAAGMAASLILMYLLSLFLIGVGKTQYDKKKEKSLKAEKTQHLKSYLTVWSRENHIDAAVSENEDGTVGITVVYSKELLTETAFLNDDVLYGAHRLPLTEYGKDLFQQLSKKLYNEYILPSDGFKRAGLRLNLVIGQKERPYQAEIDKRDITLQEVLDLKLDPEKTIQRNPNLSADNKNDMEKYTKLKKMFA